MINRFRFYPVFLAWVLLLTALDAMATSFLVPTDRELVNRADAVVVATTQGSYAMATNGGIQTHYELTIERVFKGRLQAGETLSLTEAGGVVGDQAAVVFGTPQYAAGERSLIFLDRRGGNEWRTWGMILGKFNFVRDDLGTEMLLRGAGGNEIFGWDYEWKRHREPSRSADGFLNFIEATVCGVESTESYLVEPAEGSRRIQPASHGFSALDYEGLTFPFDHDNNPSTAMITVGARWATMLAGGSATFRTLGTQAGSADSLLAVGRAMNAWNSDPNSSIGLAQGGTNGTPYNTVTGGGDGINSIEFNSNTVDLGPQAVGVSSVRASSPYDGFVHFDIVESDVAIKAGVSFGQTLLDEVLTHELGHSLNFRHSNDRAPATSVAVMHFISMTLYGANLQGWDRDAASHVYGAGGSSCTPASITSQPQANPSTITQGQSSNLSLGVAGDSPTVQWFNAGTSALVGSGSPLSVSPQTTTSFFARVTNSCNPGGTQSNTVTVTVNAPVCVPASITSQPSSQTINPGASAVLTVGVDGTAPLTVQWFTSGGSPAGNGTSIIVSPPATTSFFARVTNSCNTAGAQSVTVTVTVNTPQCVPAFITSQPSSQTIVAGSFAVLTVGVSGTSPITVQWFTTGGAFAGNGPSINVSPAATTSFFARISNACQQATDSLVATVTVQAACVPAFITFQPASQTIIAGSSTVLTVGVGGSQPLTVQWFTTGGASAGNGESISVSPTVTTSYFARVSNSCNPGGTDSNVATVTVQPNCTQATITSQPQSRAITTGQSTTLSVGASGSGLTFQWFQNGSAIGGATGSSITVSPMVTSTYFVRISNSCTSAFDSQSATVTVSPAGPPPTSRRRNVGRR